MRRRLFCTPESGERLCRMPLLCFPPLSSRAPPRCAMSRHGTTRHRKQLKSALDRGGNSPNNSELASVLAKARNDPVRQPAGPLTIFNRSPFSKNSLRLIALPCVAYCESRRHVGSTLDATLRPSLRSSCPVHAEPSDPDYTCPYRQRSSKCRKMSRTARLPGRCRSTARALPHIHIPILRPKRELALGQLRRRTRAHVAICGAWNQARSG
jgi:hypothetical protein